MDFKYTDEQQMLASAAGDLLAQAYDPETRNAVVSTDLGWSRDVWAQCAEMGLLGLPFSEGDGGMGAGPIEIMGVMTEIGRRLAPEPFLDVVVVAGGLVEECGTAEQRAELLPRLAEGALLVAFAHREPGTRWPASAVSTTAVRDGGEWLLSGVKSAVPHGDCADQLIVSATLPDGAGVGLFLVDAAARGVTRTPYVTHDSLRGAQCQFDSTPGAPLGDAVDRSEAISVIDVRAQAALAAEAVGAMAEAMRLTTEYLKTRKQFGVPLASFQALTHRAADMYVLLELARGMSMYASMALAEGDFSREIAARAQLQIGRSARKIGQEAIQLHGGIGVTAEYPVSHYVSRLLAIEHTLGGSEEHLHTLMGGLREHDVVSL